jgi:DHA1 family bicyclomycin/chloramphenicol resistance-like MFS transporter
MLMALAPAVAPTLGGVLLLVLPWPSVFIFLGIYGVLMIALIRVFLPESLPEVQSLHPRAIARNYTELLADPFFLTVTVTSGMVYSGLMVYLVSSSFIYIDMFGVPPQYFGLIFLASVVGYMAGSALSARLARRQDSERIMRLGVILGMVAACLLLACSSTWPTSVLALMLPMMLYSIAMGLVLPHAMAIALRPFPHIAGTASALLGFIQMSLSAGASALTGLVLTTTPQPMVWMLLAIASISLALGLRAHSLYSGTKP